jgi:hypothetical protein
MKLLGFDWAQPTLSELERGLRPTGVDELFALAVVLETTVVRLLDPSPEPSPSAIDLTSTGPVLTPEIARGYLVNTANPWALEPAESIPRVSWTGNGPIWWAHGTDLQTLVTMTLERVRQQDLKDLWELNPDEFKERIRQALEAAPEEGGTAS